MERSKSDVFSKISLLIVLAIAFIFFRPVKIVPDGSVGVRSKLGKLSDEELKPGLYFSVPKFNEVKIVDTKVRTIDYTKSYTYIDKDKLIQEFLSDKTSFERRQVIRAKLKELKRMKEKGFIKKPPIRVLDQRGLPVDVELTVQYRLVPSQAAEILREWGPDWEDKLINPTVRQVVRDVISKYPAERIPILRSEIAFEIEKEVRKSISYISGNKIQVVGAKLRNITMPKYVMQKLERILKAEAKSISIVKEAEGYAEANKILSETINENILKWRSLDIQEKFVESLKENKNINIILTAPNADMHYWINGKGINGDK